MKVLEHWGLPPELVEQVMSVHAEQRLRAHYISVHKKKMRQTLVLIEGDIFLKHTLPPYTAEHLKARGSWLWMKWCRNDDRWIQVQSKSAYWN